MVFMAAQAQTDLQQTLDALASAPPSRAGEITEIDLSPYGPQTKTLEVRNGVRVRFVNGILTCTDDLKDPIVNISGGSYLELASTAAIMSGKGNCNTNHGIVTMRGGDFYITGGQMLNNPSVDWGCCMILSEPELIDSGINNIKMTSGNIFGPIWSYKDTDHIELTGGAVSGLMAYGRKASIILGGVEIESFTSVGGPDNVVPKITAPLKSEIEFDVGVVDAIAVRGGNYSITDSDLQKIRVHCNFEDDWEVYYDGDFVRFREKQGIKNSADLQAAIDALTGPGTIEIPADGVLIDEPIHIGDHQVTLTGGPLNVAENFLTSNDMVFSINHIKGRLTLKDITYNENNTYHPVSRFYVNGGHLVFDTGFKTDKLYQVNHPFYNGFVSSSNALIEIKDGNFKLPNCSLIYSEAESTVRISGGEILSRRPFTGKMNVTQSGGLIRYYDLVINNNTPPPSIKVPVDQIYDYFIDFDGSYNFNGGTIERLQYGVIGVNSTKYSGGQIIGDYTECKNGEITGTPDFTTGFISFIGENSVSGNVKLPECRLYHDSKIYVTSKLTYNWTMKGLFWSQFSLNEPFILSSDSYKLTKADFEKMQFVDLPSGVAAKFNEEEGYVYLAEHSLQDAIDALTGPGTIEIPAEGVLIDQPVIVGEHQVTLTGGPLNVAEGFDANTGADFVFSIGSGGSLTLKNITYNENNNYHHSSRFHVNGGTLIFDTGFKLANPYQGKNYTTCFVYCEGAFIEVRDGSIQLSYGNVIRAGKMSEIYIKGGELISGSDNAVIQGIAYVNQSAGYIRTSSKEAVILSESKSSFWIQGGTIDGGSNGTAVDPRLGKTYYLGGSIKGNLSISTGTISEHPNFNELKELFFSGRTDVAGNIKLPECRLYYDTQIYVTSKLTYNWIIKIPLWRDFELNKPFILSSDSYKLTKADFEKMTFLDLPKGVKAKFNEEEGYVYLGKRTLQDEIDEYAEKGEGTITPGDDGLDVDEDVTVPDDLQLLIDGLAENGTNGDMRFNGGNLNVPPTASVTIKNININGCGKGNHIYVDGTLVIEETVTVKQFIDIFIHVRRGGHVIWKGGNAGGTGSSEAVTIPIYNDGGTVEYRGGSVHGTDTGIKNAGGTVVIYGGIVSGGSGGGIYNYTGGTVRINDGRIYGGIFNYGTMHIYNGEIHGTQSVPSVSNYGDFTMYEGMLDGGGSGISITTITDITICGCVDMQDIYIHLGVKIFITAKIETEVRIHVIIDGDVPGETVLVYGANGYNLTQSDFDKLRFILPNGWIAKFDPVTLSITVSKPAGIDGVTNDADDTVHDVYNLQGIKVGNSDNTASLQSGLYIINGKKVYINN